MKRIGSCILTLLLFGSVCYAGDEVAKTSGNLVDSVHLSRLVEKFGVRSNATAVEGYSFVTLIPFVTKAQNTRTNLGLNNISRASVVKGANPVANVHLFLVDSGGYPAGEGDYVVQSNELLQINDVITALNGDVDTGWLFILSDEPLYAWASVIFNDSHKTSGKAGGLVL